jgi:hypothetical protein
MSLKKNPDKENPLNIYPYGAVGLGIYFATIIAKDKVMVNQTGPK